MHILQVLGGELLRQGHGEDGEGAHAKELEEGAVGEQVAHRESAGGVFIARLGGDEPHNGGGNDEDDGGDAIDGAQAVVLADPAAEQRADDHAEVEGSAADRDGAGDGPFSAGGGDVTIERGRDEGGETVEQQPDDEAGDGGADRHEQGGDQAGGPSGDEHGLAAELIGEIAGGSVDERHNRAGGAEDEAYCDGVCAEFGEIKGLENEEHALADAPGEKRDGDNEDRGVHGRPLGWGDDVSAFRVAK